MYMFINYSHLSVCPVAFIYIYLHSTCTNSSISHKEETMVNVDLSKELTQQSSCDLIHSSNTFDTSGIELLQGILKELSSMK